MTQQDPPRPEPTPEGLRRLTRDVWAPRERARLAVLAAIRAMRNTREDRS